MGKHRHTWPEAKKLCRLNQNDIAMAKRLGFGPDALVRARPDPKQKWKLPVKYWIHELHSERFGYVLGEKPEKPLPAAAPSTPEEDEEAARQFEEQLYWEDYRDRNQDDRPARRQAVNPNKAVATTPDAEASGIGITGDDITGDDVPF
jgi:hypothetical protein